MASTNEYLNNSNLCGRSILPGRHKQLLKIYEYEYQEIPSKIFCVTWRPLILESNSFSSSPIRLRGGDYQRVGREKNIAMTELEACKRHLAMKECAGCQLTPAVTSGSAHCLSHEPSKSCKIERYFQTLSIASI